MNKMNKIHDGVQGGGRRKHRHATISAGMLAEIALKAAEFRTKPAKSHRRVVREADMTDAQKRLVAAATRPGTPVPTELSDDALAAWFIARCGGNK